MTRPSSAEAVSITLDLSPEWLEQVDAIAAALSRPGVETTRADVLRMAMAQGLDILEAKEGVKNDK